VHAKVGSVECIQTYAATKNVLEELLKLSNIFADVLSYTTRDKTGNIWIGHA